VGLANAGRDTSMSKPKNLTKKKEGPHKPTLTSGQPHSRSANRVPEIGRRIAYDLGLWKRSLDFSVSALRWWSWKLGSTRRRGKGAKTTSVSPLTFVEVTSAVRREPIEIVLASGTRVLVPVDIELPALERLFDAIERRR